MREKAALSSALALLALVIVIGAGCGGSSSSATSESTSGQPTETNDSSSGSQSESAAKTGKAHSTSVPGKIQTEAERAPVVAEFRVPGGPKKEVNRILTGSKEASGAEREAASEALEANMEARAEHDWAAQCASLSKTFTKYIEYKGTTVVGLKRTCLKNVSFAGENAPPAALKNTMDGPVDLLRWIGGRQAFAFYHGTSNSDYLIPMEKEGGGEWKVAALTAQKIPGS